MEGSQSTGNAQVSSTDQSKLHITEAYIHEKCSWHPLAKYPLGIDLDWRFVLAKICVDSGLNLPLGHDPLDEAQLQAMKDAIDELASGIRQASGPFLSPSATSSDIDEISEESLRKGWVSAIGHYMSPSESLNPKSFPPVIRKLVKAGIPAELREHIWLMLSGGLMMLRTRRADYTDLANRADTSPFVSLIDLDMSRTFQDEQDWLKHGSAIVTRRLLCAYSLRNPSLGYCQGLSYIAATLAYYMSEELAFASLCAILEDGLVPPDYYTNLQGAVVDQQVLECLVLKYVPYFCSVLSGEVDHSVKYLINGSRLSQDQNDSGSDLSRPSTRDLSLAKAVIKECSLGSSRSSHTIIRPYSTAYSLAAYRVTNMLGVKGGVVSRPGVSSGQGFTGTGGLSGTSPTRHLVDAVSMVNRWLDISESDHETLSEYSVASIPWNMCLFSASFKIQTTARLWDFLFANGPSTLFKISVALFQSLKREYLTATISRLKKFQVSDPQAGAEAGMADLADMVESPEISSGDEGGFFDFLDSDDESPKTPMDNQSDYSSDRIISGSVTPSSVLSNNSSDQQLSPPSLEASQKIPSAFETTDAVNLDTQLSREDFPESSTVDRSRNLEFSSQSPAPVVKFVDQHPIDARALLTANVIKNLQPEDISMMFENYEDIDESLITKLRKFIRENLNDDEPSKLDLGSSWALHLHSVHTIDEEYFEMTPSKKPKKSRRSVLFKHVEAFLGK